MATHCACNAFSFSPSRELFSANFVSKSSNRSRPFLLSTITKASASYNTLVSEAVRLLGPPARFEASKLKVVLLEDHINKCASIIPRTYILSHCDFTANLTLTVSNVINLDQLRGWYKKDDVVAEWKKVKNEMCLHIHCFVCGPNPFLDVAAEFRYHIFSKEMPLVLKAIRHGDSVLFSEHPELLGSIVRVYFHSSSKKYNRMECWGALKDAMEGKQGDHLQGLMRRDRGRSPKSIFQALFAFLL
ncbi:magnesium dechelatase SGRL, chloroplastic isoform X1 [Prosopis cineraria]|uniref:magnesium dechelatase SGRL, chloroplastic isoform X1 n=2 Tax=Prosopis cineraria TaxID=364024 RepID=UPI00241023FF|nr:magnesium dechelatase SGRL, chloroplastic isoform X1 [Prosopis cineraria]